MSIYRIWKWIITGNINFDSFKVYETKIRLIDLNGISVCLEIFYADVTQSCALCIHINILCAVISQEIVLYMVESNMNNFQAGLFDPKGTTTSG